MKQVDLIVCGEYVLTMNSAMEVIKEGAVAIKGNSIVDVGKESDIRASYCTKKIIEGRQRALLPGFINTHTHAAMVYFRGIADDLPLKKWLDDYIWPAETKMLSEAFIVDAVELACLEMIKAGVTTYNDMYFFGENAAASTIKAGMRAIIGIGILDFPFVSAKTKEDHFINAQNMIDTFKGNELITPSIAPHTPYSCCSETLKKAQSMAEKNDVPLHIHLSETEWEVKEIISRYGKRPVQYLESLGFLSERVLAAHCVWLDERDIDILASYKVGVSHCIESNLKLASGIAPVPAMLKAGVKIGFGTDGAASNNDLNIIGEMSTAAKVHKAIAQDPTTMDAKTSLLMATRWGAEILGLGDRIGSLQAGKEADIISINLRKPHLSPLYDIYSHIVYAALPSDVDTVLVKGKLLMEKGCVLTLIEEEIYEKSFNWHRTIKEKLGMP